ncbi:MAG: aldo/keto reductase [Ectothiorhodospiraceae bacterium]|nr:aldo/keto reductase [Ectothiorhodospiraceae bacterium]
MRTRRFGRLGIQVSELVFGGGWVGGILIHRDDDTRREAIRRALADGINWIDTAPSYGQGQSEQALGWLLAEIPPERRPHVSTKVRLDTARLDDVEGQVERSITESLGRLRRDNVDLLILHNRIAAERAPDTVTPDDVLRPGGVLDAMARVRDRGLTRHLGITALGETGPCIQVIDSGRVDAAQVYYNLLNPSAARTMRGGWSAQSFAGIIDACRRQDVGIMGIRVLAAGVIATDERHGREVQIATGSDLDTETRRAHAAFAALGDGHGTRAQTAIRFALANGDLSCVVVGMAELDHLDQALAAARMGPLPPDALSALERLHDSDFAAS